MSAFDSSQLREVFALLEWATPYLDHPDWHVYPRRRTLKTHASDSAYDRYCSVTLQGDSCIQEWAELSQKPAPGTTAVTKSISLFKYGIGLAGYPTMCHGGAIMSMIDEAFGNMMIASQREAAGLDPQAWTELTDNTWDAEEIKDEKTLREVIKGAFVTAQLSFEFLKPVRSPGVVGVECTMVEKMQNKMRIEAVMKDGKGTPLVKAESLWVRLGKEKL